MSRNRVQNGLRDGSILVDGQQVKPNHKNLPPTSSSASSCRATATRIRGLLAQNIPLDVRYEDEALLIVHKPPGMVVHTPA